MPTKPPSDRTRAKGVLPSPEFWILTSGFSPKMQNEPNSSIPGVPPPRPHPKNTKRTQSHPDKYAKRTQSQPANSQSPKAKSQKMRNEPNFACPTAQLFTIHCSLFTLFTKRTQFQRRPTCGRPKNAKRTQKDNARCNRAAPVFNPGLPTGDTPPTKNAKRTQSCAPIVIPSVGLRSEAQRPKAEGPAKTPSPKAIPHKHLFTKSSGSSVFSVASKKKRNEPNSPPDFHPAKTRIIKGVRPQWHCHA